MSASFFSEALSEIRKKGVLNILAVLVNQSGKGPEYQLIQPDQNDGFLFSINPWTPLEFSILIDLPVKHNDIQVVTVCGRDKTIVSKQSITPDKHYRRFVKRVRNRATENVPYLSTKHEGNNTRIIFTANGQFEMWEVAIPTRILNGQAHFFLTVQKLYEGRMYNYEGKVYIPETQYAGYQNWPNLQEYLGKAVPLNQLEEIDSDQMLEILVSSEDQLEEIPAVEDNAGVVKYFCLASGLGLAAVNVNNAMIHWSQILSPERLACLEKGQPIRFDRIVLGTKDAETVLFLKGVEK
ncbi:MAG: hypothetical protein A3C71_00705 [Candidatus Yanofskybacteria bacterium RIFCSPHIGHO2_02_FULL_43_15c]|uniref:Uncharacterized protein n=1 Tax=Candidatus Yanofskybacteria bacterium RIFCSPHIGHO2_02_FULL_43_15c TaxID=1802679 RepID=A0A1F8FGB4_9BACT|nr:MAG: hypothetical protein A3C71_00705 [Candidatus Yanofskybacteria bacterium RIFCSPHIGHO2_02_FULL_43_15c]